MRGGVRGLVVPSGGGGTGGISGINISAGTTNQDLSNISFANGSGVSFGINGSTITASVAAGAQTGISGVIVSDATFTSGTVSFGNLNGISFGSNGANKITASYTVPPAQTAFVLSNSNGISFGTNGSTVTATVKTDYQSSGAYLTTAAQVSQVVNSINGDTGTFSFNTGSSLSSSRVGNAITFGLASNISTYLQTTGNYLTSGSVNFSAGTTSSSISQLKFGDSNGISFGLGALSVLTGTVKTAYLGLGTAQTNVTWTANSDGISFNAGGYAGTSTGFTGANISASMTNNTLGLALSLSVAAPGGGGSVNFSGGTTSSNLTRLKFSDSNGISFGLQTGSVLTGTVKTAYMGLGTAQTNVTWTANSDGLSINAGGYAGTSTGFTGANVTGAMTHNTLGLALSLSVAAPGGGAVQTRNFEPFYFQDGTITATQTLSQLNVQYFSLPNDQSFGNINMIGLGSVVATSASNSWSVRLTNSTQGMSYSRVHTYGNSNLVDLFLFKRGTGVFSSEIETFASTRNSFATIYNMTYGANATLTDTAGGSLRASQTLSMSISYPFLTSYTSTSINAASTYTGWSSGYTTWTSTASNNSSFTFSTSAARTLSIASTYPATVGWSGAKLIYMNFGTSLSAGEYWLGMLRHSSSSSSSNSGNSFTGAAGTGNSYSITFNDTAYSTTAVLSFAGKTNTVVNSLGSFGFVTTDIMAPMMGLGLFSGTWASNTAYLNNLGNPLGAIAFSQIKTTSSFFQSWFQMASNRQ